jgi:hypothetical protein
MDPRPAREVIDQAISDNKLSEYLLYALALLFAGVGLAVLCFSVYQGSIVLSLVSLVASSLFWPAMSSARRTRKECIAIRLLEAPLSRADTAKEAADTIRQLVAHIVTDGRKDG